MFPCFSSGVDSDNVKAEKDEYDDVELEKSNVLLMGPTGSGKITSFWVLIEFAFGRDYMKSSITSQF